MTETNAKQPAVVPLGTIYTARAKLYDSDGRLVGTCMDAPNPIARAFMECPSAYTVHHLLGWSFRGDYGDRMNSYNTASSYFTPYVAQEG